MNNFNKERHYRFEARAWWVVHFSRYLHTQWYCQKAREEKGEGLDRGHRAGNKGSLQLDQIVQLYLLLSILIPWGAWGERACPFVSCVGSRQTALPSCFPSDSDHPNPSLPVDIDLISLLILGFPASAFTVRPHHPLAPTCIWPPVFAVRLHIG